MTPSNPRLWAAMAAQAIVFTLFGARGQSPLTGPSYRVRGSSPTVFTSSARRPVSLNADGCFFIVTFRPYGIISGEMQTFSTAPKRTSTMDPFLVVLSLSEFPCRPFSVCLVLPRRRRQARRAREVHPEPLSIGSFPRQPQPGQWGTLPGGGEKDTQ